VRHALLTVAFYNWSAATPAKWSLQSNTLSHGWSVSDTLSYAVDLLVQTRLTFAAAQSQLYNLRADLRPFLREDRDLHLIAMSAKAQDCAARNDTKGAYNVVRALAARSPKTLPYVLLENGARASSEDERQARWTRHFAVVFNAPVVHSLEPLMTVPLSRVMNHNFHPSKSQLGAAVRRMPNNRACGKDGVHAEIVKAGGDAFLDHLFGVTQELIETEVVPVQWRGGRITDLYKGKGPSGDCDNSRGLLLSEHVGKAVMDLLKQEIEPAYQANVPASQYGAVKGGGTDFPHHALHAAMDYARLVNHSAWFS
jgi:hypothetical protein